MDKTRRSENKTLSKTEDNPLARSKYLWLKAPDALTEKQKMTFAALSGLELETAKVWLFKESFRVKMQTRARLDALEAMLPN